MSGCMLHACFWLELDSEFKIKYFNQNRSKWTNRLPSEDWTQPCVSPTSHEPMGWLEDRWDSRVCPHTEPHGELYLGREQIDCASTHLCGCRERKKESKREGYTTIPASLPSFLPPPQGECAGCKSPRKWEVWPIFPWLLQAPSSTQDWLVQSWWAAHNVLLAILHCLFTPLSLRRTHWLPQSIVKYLPSMSRLCQV